MGAKTTFLLGQLPVHFDYPWIGRVPGFFLEIRWMLTGASNTQPANRGLSDPGHSLQVKNHSIPKVLREVLSSVLFFWYHDP